MSNELIKVLRHIHDLERMPRLSNNEPVRFSNEALNIVAKDGLNALSVTRLKARLEDVQGNAVTIAFAFCDDNDNPIVNVGRVKMVGAGSTITLCEIANTLNFTVT